MRAMVCSTGCIAGAAAINSGRPSARSNLASASNCCVRCRARCSSTCVRRMASRRSFSQGFWIKSRAPRRMASTARPTLPQAVITITGMLLSSATISESRSRPFLARGGIARVVQIDQDCVIELAGQRLAHGAGRLRRVDRKPRRAQQQLQRFEDVRLVVSGENASGALPITRFAGSVLRRGWIGWTLCSWQTSLPQGAVPSTALCISTLFSSRVVPVALCNSSLDF